MLRKGYAHGKIRASGSIPDRVQKALARHLLRARRTPCAPSASLSELQVNSCHGVAAACKNAKLLQLQLRCSLAAGTQGSWGEAGRPQ